MWVIEGNNILYNGTRIACVNDGRLHRIYSRRIPINILEQAHVNENEIANVRAQDSRYYETRRSLNNSFSFDNDGFDYTRTFGIEIEGYHPDNEDIREDLATLISRAGLPCTYRGYTHEHIDSWKVVTDGSLCGHYTFEIVSPILKGREGFEQIKTVLEVLHLAGCEVNRSCGLHIHHQASDLSRTRIKTTFNTYAKNEALIDSFMPPSRRRDNSRWAQSISANINLLNEIMHNHGHNGRNDYRYFKINMQSYYVYGTVEFRQHSGTIDFKKINNWIRFTQAMLLRSNNQRFASVEEMINGLEINDGGYFRQRANYFAKVENRTTPIPAETIENLPIPNFA